MIYTVTLNPSIDYIVRLPHLVLDEVNRMTSDDKYVGGKGINVSRILQRLSIDNTAIGFVGGFTGQFVVDGLEAEKIKTDFVAVDQDTRINVKIKAEDETEINGGGPLISEHHLAEFRDLLNKLTKNDIVVFAGSAPKNLGNPIYKDLIALVKSKGAEVVCDFEGQTLLDALQFNPLLVKPNNHELAAIYGVELKTLDAIKQYAHRLLSDGAKHVIISMAGEGALLAFGKDTYFAKPIKGKVKNSVGAGDSMVAGFTGEFSRSQDPVEAFKWGVACGSATAFSDDLASESAIKDIYDKVEVEKI